MWVCPKNSTLLLVITVGLFMASGCSGHSVKYGANSDGDGNGIETDGTMHQANSSGEESGIDGGTISGSNPYPGSRRGHVEGSAGSSMPTTANKGAEVMGGVDGVSVQGGTNYGHDYNGVNGSGPDHGPVSGFGNGSASSTNPDPESWANAYLGNGKNGREFYGDPSKAGISYNGSATEGMNPATWAENYTKENGGPSPEYVNPDMNIAHANGQHTGGSVGIGRTDANGLIVESSFSEAMGTQSGNVQDIYFAFDSWNISPEAAKFLEEGAQWLQAHPGKALMIEGHCDQRGTQDYNLVLGQKRAEAAREYLVHLGVQADRIKIVSYGKERPFCQNDSEDCFQENRRNHMVVRVN